MGLLSLRATPRPGIPQFARPLAAMCLLCSLILAGCVADNHSAPKAGPEQVDEFTWTTEQPGTRGVRMAIAGESANYCKWTVTGAGFAPRTNHTIAAVVTGGAIDSPLQTTRGQTNPLESDAALQAAGAEAAASEWAQWEASLTGEFRSVAGANATLTALGTHLHRGDDANQQLFEGSTNATFAVVIECDEALSIVVDAIADEGLVFTAQSLHRQGTRGAAGTGAGYTTATGQATATLHANQSGEIGARISGDVALIHAGAGNVIVTWPGGERQMVDRPSALAVEGNDGLPALVERAGAGTYSVSATHWSNSRTSLLSGYIVAWQHVER